MLQEDWSFRRKLVHLIEEQMSVLSEPVVTGGCRSFDEYKHMSGKIAALKDVLAMIEQIIETDRPK